MAELGGEQPPEENQQEGFSAEERDALKKLAEISEDVASIPPSRSSRDLQRKEDVGDIFLKRVYGAALLLALLSQLVFADYMFFRYAKNGVHWNIDPGVMKAWLAATVVEVIGITAIVVRHLYPHRTDPGLNLFGWLPRRKPKNGDAS